MALAVGSVVFVQRATGSGNAPGWDPALVTAVGGAGPGGSTQVSVIRFAQVDGTAQVQAGILTTVNVFADRPTADPYRVTHASGSTLVGSQV
jgi:hypothetical protein